MAFKLENHARYKRMRSNETSNGGLSHVLGLFLMLRTGETKRRPLFIGQALLSPWPTNHSFD